MIEILIILVALLVLALVAGTLLWRRSVASKPPPVEEYRVSESHHY